MNRREFLVGAAGLPLVPTSGRAGPNNPVGLIFIGQRSCPYCLTIAPVFHDLRAHGLSVLPVSMDGAPVPPFKTFHDGRRHPVSASVSEVPTVLVYHAGLDRITHELVGFRDMRSYVLRLSRALGEARQLS